MLLYRGQPTAAAVAAGRERMTPWLRAALASDANRSLALAQGRWFTDDLAIACWYADDAGTASEIVTLEVGDEIAEAFRLSNLRGPLACGLDPLAYSRDPEREFMLPRHIAGRARTLTGEVLFAGPSSIRPLTPGELAFMARETAALDAAITAALAERQPRSDFAARRAARQSAMASC